MTGRYISCRAPEEDPTGLWFVKMDSPHNPSYYLVNRLDSAHPRVAMKKDLIDILNADVWFCSEKSAQMAIKWYLEFQTNRGATPMTAQPTQVTIESQIMEFIE